MQSDDSDAEGLDLVPEIKESCGGHGDIVAHETVLVGGVWEKIEA